MSILYEEYVGVNRASIRDDSPIRRVYVDSGSSRTSNLKSVEKEAYCIDDHQSQTLAGREGL